MKKDTHTLGRPRADPGPPASQARGSAARGSARDRPLQRRAGPRPLAARGGRFPRRQATRVLSRWDGAFFDPTTTTAASITAGPPVQAPSVRSWERTMENTPPARDSAEIFTRLRRQEYPAAFLPRALAAFDYTRAREASHRYSHKLWGFSTDHHAFWGCRSGRYVTPPRGSNHQGDNCKKTYDPSSPESLRNSSTANATAPPHNACHSSLTPVLVRG